MFDNLIATLIDWFTSFVEIYVPTFGLADANMTSMSSAVDAICEFISAVNFVVPLPTIAAIVAADAAIRFSQLTLFIINWIVRRIADFVP